MREPGEILCDKKEFTQIGARDWPTVRWNSKTRARARSKSTNADFSFGEPSNECIKRRKNRWKKYSHQKERNSRLSVIVIDRSYRDKATLKRSSYVNSRIRFKVNIAPNTSCHVWCRYGHSRAFVNPIPVVEKQIHPIVKQKFELLTTPVFLLIKEPIRLRKWCTSTEQQERDKAKDALRNCIRHGVDSMLDRCIEDDRYRESQLSIGWSEEEAKASNVLGSNDDTYQVSKEERDLNSEQRSKKDRGLLPLIP